MSDKPKARGGRAGVFVALHVLLLIYSLSGIFSKLASGQPFLSPAFVGLYGGMLVILGIYAIVWQQVIKRLPLSVAFANKAATVVWGIVWGAVVFHERVTLGMVVGAVVVIVGVVLYSTADDGPAEPAAQDETHGGDAR